MSPLYFGEGIIIFSNCCFIDVLCFEENKTWLKKVQPGKASDLTFCEVIFSIDEGLRRS